MRVKTLGQRYSTKQKNMMSYTETPTSVTDHDLQLN